MRLILMFVGAFACSALANPSAGLAASYPWCVHYSDDLGSTNCGFVSFEQCMAARSGNGGYCSENTQYQAVVTQPAPRRNRRPN